MTAVLRERHTESISLTPVVFGIRESLAGKLGFTDREVSVNDILEAIRGEKMNFCMTSATQSNSGASAYIGFLYALLGKQEGLTVEDLQGETLQTGIRELLGGVERSSGSSDWLKELFLSRDYDAMAQILIQENAKQNFLQANDGEVNIAVLFSGSVRSVLYAADSSGEALEALYQEIEGYGTGGGTDIYTAVGKALELAGEYDLSKYSPAIILMTDGRSEEHMQVFEDACRSTGLDIPVFSITFGDADTEQLENLAEKTGARVFDGTSDLAEAFRSVKGYN